MGELNDLMNTIRQNPSCPDGNAKMEMLHGYDNLDAGSTELLTEALKRERRKPTMKRHEEASLPEPAPVRVQPDVQRRG